MSVHHLVGCWRWRLGAAAARAGWGEEEGGAGWGEEGGVARRGPAPHQKGGGRFFENIFFLIGFFSFPPVTRFITGEIISCVVIPIRHRVFNCQLYARLRKPHTRTILLPHRRDWRYGGGRLRKSKPQRKGPQGLREQADD